ncbi:MAG: Gfo/Idh/MocA family oxidoreductase [Pirellulaceae bacterium]|nr:Gfo/Idh/MocA family oxidoreductase [Pirellulaceae bacterium]
MNGRKTSRRNFLAKTSTAVTVATVCNHGRIAKSAPSERIRAGFVGVGGRARLLLKHFSAQKDVDIVALSDIDSRRIPQAVEYVKEHNGNHPKTYEDFRHIVDDPRIDIMVVGTPDHWHAIPTIMGCLAGKDVYVEKPDGHNILEGQTIVAAARKEQRVVQLGTQSRSCAHFLEAMEYIKTGALGKVLVAKAWESSKQGNIGYPSDTRPPAGVDYDTWLGPAPKRPYNPRRFHGSWRWFFDYGTGDLGNDGVHRLDYARWALNAALEAQGESPVSLPTKITATGGKWYFSDAQEWPDTLQVTYEYPSQNDQQAGRLLTYEMRIWTPYNTRGGDLSEGAIIYGDKGYIVFGNRHWKAYTEREKLVAEGKGSLSADPHVRNFLDCVKSRQKPNADIETVGHPSSVLTHAANVAWRVGRQVILDPNTETFVGDDEANSFRTRPEYRKPWLLPDV